MPYSTSYRSFMVAILDLIACTTRDGRPQFRNEEKRGILTPTQTVARIWLLLSQRLLFWGRCASFSSVCLQGTLVGSLGSANPLFICIASSVQIISLEMVPKIVKNLRFSTCPWQQSLEALEQSRLLSIALQLVKSN